MECGGTTPRFPPRRGPSKYGVRPATEDSRTGPLEDGFAVLQSADMSAHSKPHAPYPAFFQQQWPVAGSLPRKQLRLVLAWIELHLNELLADWDLAHSGEIPYKITPL